MNLQTKTIGQCLEDIATKFPHRVAVFHKKEYTWQQLNTISDHIASKYLALHVGYGTKVAIWGINSFSWIVNYFALVKIGAIPVLINVHCKAAELEQILGYAECEILLKAEKYKTTDYSDILSQVNRKHLPKLNYILDMEVPFPSATDEALSLNEQSIFTLNAAKAKIHCDDVATMMFTSGTTSIAKGVLLTHKNLVNNSAQHVRSLALNEADVFCLSVPLFHCFGLTAALLASLHSGMRLQILEYYRSEDVLYNIENYSCTVLCGVPSMFLALINNPNFSKFSTDSIRCGIIAGSLISQEAYFKITNAFQNFNLLQAYGLTEASPCISATKLTDDKTLCARSVGCAVEGVEIRIIDIHTGQPCAANAKGEIQARGYNIMKGYWHLPDEMNQAISQDGWLKTGDIGSLDENGYLYISGRMKEIIIRGGENISPFEIESVIQKMDGVHQAKVIGLPDPILQEKIVACVIKSPEIPMTKEAIKEFARQYLSDYKVPQDICFLSHFPLTPSGKIDLGALRQTVIKISLDDK